MKAGFSWFFFLTKNSTFMEATLGKSCAAGPVRVEGVYNTF